MLFVIYLTVYEVARAGWTLALNSRVTVYIDFVTRDANNRACEVYLPDFKHLLASKKNLIGSYF